VTSERVRAMLQSEPARRSVAQAAVMMPRRALMAVAAAAAAARGA
jgi:hypothetical protein